MALTAVPVDEHSLYPWHEEDDVPQGSEHLDQCSYWKHALKRHHPAWRVESDLCLYWEPQNTWLYRAADLAVIDGPTPVPATNYLAWCDGPLLLVAEVASDRTRNLDLGVKFEVYESKLRALEYLYFDGASLQTRLWQLREGSYVEVEPDSEGRLWSSQLGLWFGLEANGLLRAYTREGQRLLTHDEEAERADTEARRAETEARRAETEARRAETEARRADTEAQRAGSEARARSEMEAKLAERDRQLAEALAQIERLRMPR